MKKNKFIKSIIIFFLLLTTGLTVWIILNAESFDVRNKAQESLKKPYVTLSVNEVRNTGAHLCFFVSKFNTTPDNVVLVIDEQDYPALFDFDKNRYETCFDLEFFEGQKDMHVVAGYGGEVRNWTYEFKLTGNEETLFGQWEIVHTETQGLPTVIGAVLNQMNGLTPADFDQIQGENIQGISIAGSPGHRLRVKYFPRENYSGSLFIYLDPFNGNAEQIESPYEFAVLQDTSYLFIGAEVAIPVYPDVTVESLNFSEGDIYPDTNFQFTVNVTNIGAGVLEESSVGIYIDGVLRKTFLLQNLNPEETIAHVEALLAPDQIGQHNLKIVCDPENQVEEENEENNSLTKIFAVRKPPCDKTCGEKEILTQDCRCVSVECTQDGHCGGFEICDLSNNSCFCQNEMCTKPKVVNATCTECVCPTSCSQDQIQLTDCSCRDKVEAKPGEKAEKELILEIVRPSNNQIFDEGEKLIFEAEAYYTNGDELEEELVWTSSINGEIGKGKMISYIEFDMGTHEIKLSYKDEKEAKIVVHILSGDQITIYKEKPHADSTLYEKEFTVSALISSPRGKVNTTKIQLEFNDSDVLGDSYIGESYIEYTAKEELVLEGENIVKLKAENYNDQEAVKKWKFSYAQKPPEEVAEEDGQKVNEKILVIIGLVLAGLLVLIVFVWTALKIKENRSEPTSQTSSSPHSQKGSSPLQQQIPYQENNSAQKQTNSPAEQNQSTIHRSKSQIPGVDQN